MEVQSISLARNSKIAIIIRSILYDVIEPRRRYIHLDIRQ